MVEDGTEHASVATPPPPPPPDSPATQRSQVTEIAEEARRAIFEEIDSVLDRVRSVKKKITRTEVPSMPPIPVYHTSPASPTRATGGDATSSVDYIPPPSPGVDLDEHLQLVASSAPPSVSRANSADDGETATDHVETKETEAAGTWAPLEPRDRRKRRSATPSDNNVKDDEEEKDSKGDDEEGGDDDDDRNEGDDEKGGDKKAEEAAAAAAPPTTTADVADEWPALQGAAAGQPQTVRSYSHALLHAPAASAARAAPATAATATPPPPSTAATAATAAAAARVLHAATTAPPRAAPHSATRPPSTTSATDIPRSIATAAAAISLASVSSASTSSSSPGSPASDSPQFPLVVGKKRRTQPAPAAPGPAFSSPARAMPGASAAKATAAASHGAYNYASPLRTSAASSSSSSSVNGTHSQADGGTSVLSCSPAKKQPAPQRKGPESKAKAKAKSVVFADDASAGDDAGIGGDDSGVEEEDEEEEEEEETHVTGGTSRANNGGRHHTNGTNGTVAAVVQRQGGTKAPAHGKSTARHDDGDGDDEWWAADSAAASRRARKKARLAAPPGPVVAAQALLLLALAAAGLLFSGAFGGGPGAAHWLSQQYLGPDLYPRTAAELRALAVSPAAPPLRRVAPRDVALPSNEQRSGASAAAAAVYDFFEQGGARGAAGAEARRARLAAVEAEIDLLRGTGLFNSDPAYNRSARALLDAEDTPAPAPAPAPGSYEAYVALAAADPLMAPPLGTDVDPSAVAATTAAATTTAAASSTTVAAMASDREVATAMLQPGEGAAALAAAVAWEFRGPLLAELRAGQRAARFVVDVRLDGRRLVFPTGDRFDLAAPDGAPVHLSLRLEEHGAEPGVREVAVRAVVVTPLPGSSSNSSSGDAPAAADGEAAPSIAGDCAAVGSSRCRAYVLPVATRRFYFVPPAPHPAYDREVATYNEFLRQRREHFREQMEADNGGADVPAPDEAVAASAPGPGQQGQQQQQPPPPPRDKLPSALSGHRGGGQGHFFAARGLAIVAPVAEARLAMPTPPPGNPVPPLAVIKLVLSLPRRLCAPATADRPWSLRAGTVRLRVHHGYVASEGPSAGVASASTMDATQIALDHCNDDPRDHARSPNYAVHIDVRGLVRGKHTVHAAVVAADGDGDVGAGAGAGADDALFWDAVRFTIE